MLYKAHVEPVGRQTGRQVRPVRLGPSFEQDRDSRHLGGLAVWEYARIEELYEGICVCVCLVKWIREADVQQVGI